ncbi:MAG: DUF4276 family protein [Anaerolineae bacterium]|nr:DUF4276 family protein [Anaerolineae bacterium]
MTIVILVEGNTEVGLIDHIRNFVAMQAKQFNRQPAKLKSIVMDGRNPITIGKQIRNSLNMPDVNAVVGLIDVYPQFKHAIEAKEWLMNIAQDAGIRQHFYAHAAQYDVEAWLLPYWDAICQRIGVKQTPISQHPENVNGTQPPAYRLQALYQRAKPPRRYVKTKEMPAILRGKDLGLSINACPEFKAFINTLLKLNNLSPIL